MNKLLLALLGVVFPTVRAFSADVDALKIHCKSGEDVTILLDDNPLVRFVGNNLVISTEKNEISLPSEQALKITYLNVDSDGISSIEMSGLVFSFSKQSLSINNLGPMASVSLYTIDGILIASAVTDTNGSVTLSLPSQSETVYIVQTPTISFKIKRP